MKKRKDILCDADANAEAVRSRKSRRLDGTVSDLLSIMEMEEDSSINDPLQLELEHQQKALSNGINAQSNSNAPLPFVDTDTVPLSQDQERGMVLYNPSNGNAPFFNSSSTCFPIIINSHLLPGLKDRLSLPQDLWTVKSMEERAMYNGSTSGPNDCLAVVPWAAPQTPLASSVPEVGITLPKQPMEAEDMEAEMMDAENISTNDGAEASQLWQQQQQQQHCLMPQFPQNMYTPFTW